ncbi:2-amino-4-hydroxy-6-hydroxymethyldihydropteridine diphosphokinase [Parabacteroides sp. PFB2-12]|uniref:2-amino-4-hydroxy-6- hydroxymethyldihydropteridine diphosphokinase n=1 Tax=unclassified Parabacteroides TaxID=2649774 RepID=UPI0024748A03|nr:MULTISPECIES: 2-amino-4-hydroxy-6-hydroxymethyldihydropteridine diphosphokinase [unclassified Parabacteroides]MDH6341710.1 2-amino-4-hydroxy-6-hydroxymethyldihydropteridine diphosphokinase [Parabacteroides sp. PM6-13]MDH6389867.1 2-amino-4-hydroxy-6-hydroxymethyldihydropteridine diphosphokinase [Parabacteroides sp. PFB2-12]
MLNSAFISIGTNVDRERHCREAADRLATLFEELYFSDPIETEAVGKVKEAAPYINQVAAGFTGLDRETLQERLKAIERELGRQPEDKGSGRVPIDLDLLIWNEEVLRPNDMRQDYVRLCLPSLQAKISCTNLSARCLFE